MSGVEDGFVTPGDAGAYDDQDDGTVDDQAYDVRATDGPADMEELADKQGDIVDGLTPERLPDGRP